MVAGHVHHSQLLKKLSLTDIISVETTFMCSHLAIVYKMELMVLL